MPMKTRGRSRKHGWTDFSSIENDSSFEAVYLRWASVNNLALAKCGREGCPQCRRKNFRFRHDKEFGNIRFYCPDCHFETSFHIIPPKKSLSEIEVYDERGILIGIKTADFYHEKTQREDVDQRVLISEQRLDLGGEWFDGTSGASSQSRYMTREEVLNRLDIRKMKSKIEANLQEIENIERADRSSDFQELHEITRD
jgi:transposase-like protein